MSDALKLELKQSDQEVFELFSKRNSLPLVLEALVRKYTPQDISKVGTPQRVWELCGLYYRMENRPYEALELFGILYSRMLEAQTTKSWVHKAIPLVWMSDCYRELGYRLHSKRYLMLTLCEDAINWKADIPPDTTGAYFRLVWKQGLSDADFTKYSRQIWSLYQQYPEYANYPEYLLQELDDSWQVESPSPDEAFQYKISARYVNFLASKLGDGTGKALELLAEYLLSCMPGCRTRRRLRTPSTDYDVVCAMEGTEVDYRSELGRYFVCECKDWNMPADYTTMAKFCRVLDSTKARFGLLFSDKGISGSGSNAFAEREQLKIFQDRGIVIAVISLDDIKNVAAGANFIWLLRQRYESVRLDMKGRAG
jgi:hypothetical protein